jgi:hypothetical protein
VRPLRQRVGGAVRGGRAMRRITLICACALATLGLALGSPAKPLDPHSVRLARGGHVDGVPALADAPIRSCAEDDFCFDALLDGNHYGYVDPLYHGQHP